MLELKLESAVCKQCNTHWMGILENRVKRTTQNMLIGAGGMRLGSYKRDDLSRWAIQKALLMQLALKQRDIAPNLIYVTREHLDWLYAHRSTRRIPPGSAVWLFLNAPRETDEELPPDEKGRLFMGRGIRIVQQEQWALPRQVADGMLFTFTIALLGFQVWIGDFANEIAKAPIPSPPEGVRNLLTQIHPVDPTRLTPVTFPRNKRFIKGGRDFETLSTWADHFPPEPDE